ncbi:MAG: MFS transporter, partial [Prevotellaceae bacterium]|nr:MFS transporter [Prevotellaceae bacterium]
SFASSSGLLKDKTILLFFLGIVFVVGVDVGINTVAPKLLVERCSLSITDAGWGTSCYFLFRTAGAFFGAFILAGFSPHKFFVGTILLSILAMLGLIFFTQSYFSILAMIAMMGLCIANVFSIILSLALQHAPGKANEVSGLMIMGVSGGAVIPPLMGVFTKALGSQTGALWVILGCVIYLLFCSVYLSTRKKA